MNREPNAAHSRPSPLPVASGTGGEPPSAEAAPARPARGLRLGFEHGRRMVEVRASAIAAVRGSLRSW